MIAGTANTPCPDVTTVNISAVPLFLTTTVAAGTLQQQESTTTPEMDAVDEPWAKAPTLVMRHAIARAPATRNRRRILILLSCKRLAENLRNPTQSARRRQAQEVRSVKGVSVFTLCSSYPPWR